MSKTLTPGATQHTQYVPGLSCRDAAGGVAAGLEYVATHNAAFLLSDDLTQAVAAGKSKKSPAYSKL
jgi:hypothetical protein